MAPKKKDARVMLGAEPEAESGGDVADAAGAIEETRLGANMLAFEGARTMVAAADAAAGALSSEAAGDGVAASTAGVMEGLRAKILVLED